MSTVPEIDTFCKLCGQYTLPHLQNIIEIQNEKYHETCLQQPAIAKEDSSVEQTDPQTPQEQNELPPYDTEFFTCITNFVWFVVLVRKRRTQPEVLGYQNRCVAEISANPTNLMCRYITVSVSTQPAAYQVANYNIYPCLSLAFSYGIPKQVIISASLMISEYDLELLFGLQAGHLKRVVTSATSAQFIGMKLNKMGKIKNELAQRGIKNPAGYYVQFRIGSRKVNTEAFKLVSSTSQLPKEVKQSVRPPPTRKEYPKEVSKAEHEEIVGSPTEKNYE